MNKLWWLLPVAALIAYLPKIAETPLGKPLFVKTLEIGTHSKLKIETLSLSWRGPQIMHNIRWTHGTIGTLQINAPFWSFSGPFQIDNGSMNYQGVRIETDLKGVLTRRAITLDEPLIAQLQVPEALNPVTLRIEPQGFAFPLPYSLKKCKVGRAALDLGKIQLRNDQPLAALGSFLKTGARFNSPIWFTPVALRLDEGILSLGRIDALVANTIHVCAWGQIDLIKDRLDITIGIPADTLAKSFGITNVPSQYVLTMPLRGSIQKPDLKTGPAIATIAALLSAEEIPKKGVLGGVAKIVTRPPVDPDIPPPKRPFPWE